MPYKVMWSVYRDGKGTVSTAMRPSLNEAVALASQVGGLVFDEGANRVWPMETFAAAAQKPTPHRVADQTRQPA